MKIVVTGNIGCGKSTAVKAMLEILGEYELFDFDQAAHSLYEVPGIKQSLIDAFGTAVRSEISELVFKDTSNLKKLREITDGPLFAMMNSYAEDADVVYDIPLYYHLREHINFKPDLVICITADRSTRIERITKRSGFTLDKINRIMMRQPDQTVLVNISDVVIANDKVSVEDFKIEVQDSLIQFINGTQI